MSHSIANSVKQINRRHLVDEVKKVIGDLIKETKTIGKFGRTIQNELKETTTALELLKQDFERVKMESLADFLTGMPNRKAFSEALVKSIDEARSENKALCLLLIDIDHFKKFNDEFGHLIGDEILRLVAKKIKETGKRQRLRGTFWRRGVRRHTAPDSSCGSRGRG